MPTLHLSVLGPPVVLVDGRRVTFRSRKVLALLVYLVLEPGPHSREGLAEMLWPDHPKDARGALRNAVFHLRSALGEVSVLLHLERDRVQFVRPDPTAGQPATVLLDLDALFAPEVTSALLDVWRGGFLEGAPLVDSPRWNEWLGSREREVRDAFGVALARLVRTCLTRGDHATALLAARRRVQLDPLHEDAYRTLMLAQRHAGDHAGVIATFGQCREVLQRELQVTPDAQTLALLREGDGRAEMARPVEPPLVGRDEHVRRAARALREGRLVLLSGQSGMGKSRLARELARQAEDAITLEGRMTDRGVPFSVVTRAVRQILSKGGTDRVPPFASVELARLVPDLLPGGTAGMSAPEERLRLFDALAATFGAVLGPGAVVVYEDVHTWDSDSLDACLYGLDTLSGQPVPVGGVMTFRSGELPEDTDRRLRALVASGRAVLVEVGPLTRSDLTAVVSVTLGLPEDTADHLTARLHPLATGNPLFMIELCRALQTDPGIGDDPGAADVPRSARVRAVVRERLASLSPLAQRLLQLAAVADVDFGASLAASVLDASGVALVEAFEQLHDASLLRDERFTHDLIQEVTLDAVPSAAREVLHSRLYTELSAAGAPAATLARHALGAKRWVAAARALLVAGDDARRVLAMEQAFACHTRAWSLLSCRGGPLDPAALDPAEVQRLAYVMVVHLADRGLLPEAEAVIREMRALGRSLRHVPMEVLAVCLAVLHEGERERTLWNSERALLDALALAEEARDVSSVTKVRNTLAHPVFSRWTPERTLAFARETVGPARAERRLTDPPAGLIEALEFLGLLELNAGRCLTALGCFEELREVTPERFRINHARALLGEGRARLALGDHDRAARDLQTALDVFEATPARAWRFEAAAALTLARLDEGDVAAATALSERYARLADEVGAAWTGRLMLDAALALTALHQQEFEAARAHASRIRDRAVTYGARYPAWSVFVPYAESVLCAALDGLNDPAAAHVARSAAASWSNRPVDLVHPMSLHVPIEAEVTVLWRSGRSDLVERRLRSLACAAEAADTAGRLRTLRERATEALTRLERRDVEPPSERHFADGR